MSSTVDRVRAAVAAAIADAPIPTDPAALDSKSRRLWEERAARRGVTLEALLREVAAAQAAQAKADAEGDDLASRIREARR